MPLWGKGKDSMAISETRRIRVTPRQAEILRLVAEGMSDKEIASHLGVSPRTIQSHMDRLFLQNGVHKRAAAVAAWLSGDSMPTSTRSRY